MINFGFSKEMNIPFEATVDAVTEALKKEGFGVLTKIDLKEKFREKLGVDFGKYMILGACNPASAHKAVLAEENIGLMLPCNVIVYEKGGKTVVSMIKPTVAMKAVENKELKQIAEDVEKQLLKAFEAI